uniref:Dirigent protein n=1 Tax=Aegilops tauschii subsp. strangulata TaxID=200361 RepID=A0A453ACD3_AEGTS
MKSTISLVRAPYRKLVDHGKPLRFPCRSFPCCLGEQFSKSTIQVMGISGLSGNGVGDGEWAIVGGTGEFAMATGTISRNFLERRGDDNIIELAIRGFLPLVQPPRSVVKIGPWGGVGGEQDITDEPWRLESITLNSAEVVDAIAFCYIDQTNQKRTAGPWGGSGGSSETIELGPSELLKEVSGTFGRYHGVSVITSLTFVTSVRIHGPFGEGAGTSFNTPIQNNSGSIVGFFGRSAKYLNTIGLYVNPA